MIKHVPQVADGGIFFFADAVRCGPMGERAMGAHWWGEAPERSIDFRNARSLSEPIVNNADTRAEPLVPEM
jgi:hypothetical protein